MEEEKEKYQQGDKCSHCGGNVSAHCCGERIIYWCDSCGSNNRKYSPNIEIETNN